MFVTEKTYIPEKLAKNNMHTHSVYSKCAKPEMIFEQMIFSAEKFGLETLAVTDHSDPGDDIDTYANFTELKERLKKINTPVRVLVGAELSAYGIGKYAEPYEVDRALDFASYSHIHYHLSSWEHPGDRSPAGYARHMINVLDELLDSGRADNIAHPFSPCKMKFFDEAQRIGMLRSISDAELGRILEKGEKNGCSWEIHTPTFFRYREFSKRFFNIGREVGVHFVVGTDAHTLAALDTGDIAEGIKEVLATKV